LRNAVPKTRKELKLMTRKQQDGFTLLESLVALVIFLAISAIVMSGMVQMMKTQGTIANRTQLHTSVRAATELLQQEIGQAGKISLPPPPPAPGWVMTTPVLVPLGQYSIKVPTAQFNNVNDPVTGNPVLFENEWITVDTGASKETVQLTCLVGPGNCLTSNTWQVTFVYSHPINTPIRAPGGFSTGIVPPDAGVLANPPLGYGGYPNGSTGTVLKLYGDINGDGSMKYVEYTCDWQNTVGNGPILYRNQMDFDAPTKPALTTSMALLTNLDPGGNPNDQNGKAVPCFTYQVQTRDGANAVANDMVFVTDVAVTLTVDTQEADPVTHAVQRETKALLNVSPRNVYQAYEFAMFNYNNRVQLTPSVTKPLFP
jgi:prepilin-type N-terminal cleavage/methylation domain-containing protein